MFAYETRRIREEHPVTQRERDIFRRSFETIKCGRFTVTVSEYNVLKLLERYGTYRMGVAFPKVSTIAAGVGRGERQVRRILRNLESYGLLVTVPRINCVSGGYTSNLYYVNHYAQVSPCWVQNMEERKRGERAKRQEGDRSGIGLRYSETGGFEVIFEGRTYLKNDNQTTDNRPKAHYVVSETDVDYVWTLFCKLPDVRPREDTKKWIILAMRKFSPDAVFKAITKIWKRSKKIVWHERYVWKVAKDMHIAWSKNEG